MSDISTPVLTVITVVRNGETVMDGCIRSVLEQGISDLEYIVIDGASTDGTLGIVRGYGSAISSVISEPDKGIYDAMNKGLRLAKGRFIHFLNADDRYFEPQTLSRLLPELSADAIAYGQLVYQEEDGTRRLLGAPFSWDRELRESHVPQPTLFVPRHFYQEVGEFDTSYRIAADYEMVLRLARRFPIRYVEQPVTVMHAGGISHRRMGLAFLEASRVSRSHGRSAIASRLTYFRRMLKWQMARMLPASAIHATRKVLGRP